MEKTFFGSKAGVLFLSLCGIHSEKMLFLGLMGYVAAFLFPKSGHDKPKTFGCGEVNIFFTYAAPSYQKQLPNAILFPQDKILTDFVFSGLPPLHPLQVIDPAKVEAALRRDAANVIKAGYNLRSGSPNTLRLRYHRV